MPKSKIVAYYSEACFYVCSNCGLSKQFNNNAKREYEYFSKIHKKVCKGENKYTPQIKKEAWEIHENHINDFRKIKKEKY